MKKILDVIKEFLSNTWNSIPKMWFYIILIALLITIFNVNLGLLVALVLAGGFVAFIWIRKIILWIKGFFK